MENPKENAPEGFRHAFWTTEGAEKYGYLVYGDMFGLPVKVYEVSRNAKCTCKFKDMEYVGLVREGEVLERVEGEMSWVFKICEDYEPYKVRYEDEFPLLDDFDEDSYGEPNYEDL